MRKTRYELEIASPAGYELDKDSIIEANKIAADAVWQSRDPRKAVANADVIYTDTWVSMGQEDEKAKRPARFWRAFEVNADLVSSRRRMSRLCTVCPHTAVMK